jgi:hypothetical protein
MQFKLHLNKLTNVLLCLLTIGNNKLGDIMPSKPLNRLDKRHIAKYLHTMKCQQGLALTYGVFGQPKMVETLSHNENQIPLQPGE